SPRISPKGDRIAFVLKDQVWFAALIGEAKPAIAFRVRGDAGSLRWSHDGSLLAFVSRRGEHSFVGVFDAAAKAVTYLDASAGRRRSGRRPRGTGPPGSTPPGARGRGGAGPSGARGLRSPVRVGLGRPQTRPPPLQSERHRPAAPLEGRRGRRQAQLPDLRSR